MSNATTQLTASEIQRIENSIAEGRLILRAGTKAGRTVEQLIAIRWSVESALEKLGQSRIKKAGFKIIDVTPAGY
jgi:hypothetical protein